MESLLGNRSALSQESTAWQKILIYGTVKFWTTPEEALRGCEGPYQGGHTLHLGAAFLCRMPQVGDSPVLHPTCLTLQNPTFTGSNLGLPAKQELKKKKINKIVFQAAMKSAFKISKEFGDIPLSPANFDSWHVSVCWWAHKAWVAQKNWALTVCS